MANHTCSIDGCDRRHYGRGWCRLHYDRWRKHGDPGGAAPQKIYGVAARDRFWPKVDVDPRRGKCWIWQAGTDTSGYGSFGIDAKRSDRAHRFAYEDLVGPIPDGLTIDHLCRNRRCVRPDHLEPVTLRENIDRGIAGHHNRVKTHCKHGHPFDEANTRVTDRGRACIACERARPRRA